MAKRSWARYIKSILITPVCVCARVSVTTISIWVRSNACFTLNLCHSSGARDRQTTSLSSSNLTGCYRALWPLGARLIYMLPVREILGRANCFAHRETAITALKCEQPCACTASLHRLPQDKLSFFFFFFFFCQVRNQTCFAGFIYWWQVYIVSCLAMSTGDLSSSARSGVPRRSTSRWVSLSLSLVHRHSQWNCDVRGSRGRPGPAVPAA